MANAGEGRTSGATEQNIEHHKWLESITQWDPSTGRHPQRARIPKVPPVLREVESDKTCYDPQVVSIGPYHHGKAGLKEGEYLKTEVASDFIKYSGKSGDIIFKKVLEVSEEARNYYVNCPDKAAFNDNKQFVRIMFLDGCFLLQYINDFIGDRQRRHTMSSHSITLVAQELLMVENQLPSIVINALLVFVPGNSLPIADLLKTFIWQMYGNLVGILRLISIGPVEREDHLLSIFRKMYLGSKKPTKPNKPKTGRDALFSMLLGQLEGRPYTSSRSYSSAKELQSVGVRFKVKSSAFPADIRFSSHLISAYLTLPEITVDTSTKAIFLNMLAYEMSKEDDPEDKRFTDFICFMDSLIDHADDVKILRSSGVLNHSLGSDERVADLFDHIGKNLIPSYNAYSMVKQGIQKRYNRKSSLWLAEVWHSYFRSPWTLIALIVAVIYLGASLTQTYFTVFPRR